MPQNPTLTLPEKEEVKEKIVGIRTANYLDTIKIWTKFKESVMISSGINPSLFDDRYGVKWVESFVERDTLFIATISGRIVGAIGLMPEQFLPYLNPHKGGPIYYCVSLFFTHRKFSEHGLDKLLVSKASNLAKEQNIPLVFGPTHGSARGS